MQVGGDVVRQRLRWLVVVLAALPALAACGGAATTHPNASASATSGISGIMLLWPGGGTSSDASPSPLPGGFGSAQGFKPWPHALVVVKADGGSDAGQVVGRLRSDDQGIFRIALSPGRYLLTGKGFGWQRKRVTVRAGGYARVRIANLAAN